MRYAFAILSAIVVVAIAHETTMLDESMDLLQESATVELATAAHAKVAVKAEDSIKTKEGAKAALKERATVMIGTHELDAEEVSVAKHALSKITMKLGVRHPIFLGEAAGISDFTSDKAKYVKGGYGRLKKILEKVDEFDLKLEAEKQKAVDDREKEYNRCDKQITEDFSVSEEVRSELVAERRQTQEEDFTEINKLHSEISGALSMENSDAATISGDINQVDAEYKAYWDETEERHQVRNVLMQALWLVCTGFASFRHTEYCTNIRQQPDYDEPSQAPPMAENMVEGQQKLLLDGMKKHTSNFGETMQPVWEQQKVADAADVNSLDGDVDMEKGFVNNRAPWGVDSEGMDARATTDKTTDDAPAELGESNEAHAHDMTNEEMSSRLTFLVESSSVPERISVPITAFIQALDSDDAAVQGGLVEALVKMDTAEGQAQSDKDYGWYNTVVSKRTVMWQTLTSAQQKKAIQLQKFETIETIHSKMDALIQQEAQDKNDHDTALATNGQNGLMCDNKIIELEALIEVCNEELTNILRLNSLLRYLVIGENPVCDPAQYKCVEGEGSCTWRNRGSAVSNEPENGDRCETETGQDIPCSYTGSKHDEDPNFPTFDNGNLDRFCACEYGFFGDNWKSCDRKSCAGYGRIRYPGNGVEALQFELQGIVPMFGKHDERAPKCVGEEGQQICTRTADADYGKGPSSGDQSTHYKPMAVCSGIRTVEHGYCDDAEGKCEYCYISSPPAEEDPNVYKQGDQRTPALVREQGLVVVPPEVAEPMPYSGEKLKCEEWFVPQANRVNGESILWDEFHYTVDADASVCKGQGVPKRNFMGMATGGCVCNQEFYGVSCNLKKCQMYGQSGPWYEKSSPIVCHGRGECEDKTTGTCTCKPMATGAICENKRCPGYDATVDTGSVEDPECGKGVGECDFPSGRCVCAQGASCGMNGQDKCPGACIYADCQANCQSQSTDGGSGVGLCDRFSGLCMCNPTGVFNGPACETPSRGDAEKNDGVQSMVWSTSMDKWGWSTCNAGYLLTGMKTDRAGSSDALYNLDQGICQRPYEAGGAITRAVEKYRCYHENWWKKFDTRGGKFCRRNYFVAGLFRSHCNSLYCIEMAKCCSVKRSLWTACKWVSTKDWTSNAAGMTVSQDTGFIVGFFRDQLHTLAGITSLRQCTPIWYGQLYKYKTRFDN